MTFELSDPFWLVIAFALGLGARQIGLPPMVGYLIAGFALQAAGARSGPLLEGIADLGITLMLFMIGLKVSVKSLASVEIFGAASIHMGITFLAGTGFVLGLGAIGIGLFAGIQPTEAALVGFALSFSSTVFAAKVLEDRGEMASRHGRIAIGILVLQDIVAVIFMAASAAALPSVFALGLVGLWFARKPLYALMERAGHGELLILFGFCMALAGYALFEVVGIKGDLGALVMGLLFAGTVKGDELSKSMLSFKDVFLIGFFLSIGQAGLPGGTVLITELFLMMFLVAKIALWMFIFLRLHLRMRTSTLSTLALANYSEFALIVAAVSVEAGWLDPQWLVALGVSVAISFVISAPLNERANTLYNRARQHLTRFETERLLAEDQPIDLGDTRILVFGMGRVGSAAFKALLRDHPGEVLGFDIDNVVVSQQRDLGRNVLRGDANNPELWYKLEGYKTRVRLVVLATPNVQSSLSAIELLRASGYRNKLVVTAFYADEERALYEAGADDVLNVYTEAGDGVAAHLAGFFPTAEGKQKTA